MKKGVFCMLFIIIQSLCPAMHSAQDKVVVKRNEAIRRLSSAKLDDKSFQCCIEELRGIAKDIESNKGQKESDMFMLEIADIQASIYVIAELQRYIRNPTEAGKDKLLQIVKPLSLDISSIVYSVIK